MKTQMNRRRNLLAALGAGAVTAPFAARAQAPGAAAGKIWRIGFLSLVPRPADIESHYYGGFLRGMRDAASKLGVTIVPIEVHTRDEIDAGFARMRQQNASGLMVLLDPLFNQQGRRIADLAATLRLPAITGDRVYVEAGCLMSYGANLAESFRHSA